MKNRTLQVSGFILTLIGWVMAVITCVLPVWRIVEDYRCIDSAIRTAGLWLYCTYHLTGRWFCNGYDFLELKITLQVARVTTCLSIGLAFMGIILATIGLDCTTMASDKRMKAILVMIAGTFHIIAGVSLGVGVTWFAVEVFRYYNDYPIHSDYDEPHHAIGEAIYIGWAGSGINLIGGAVMFWSSWKLLQQSFYYNQPKFKFVSAETSM